MILLWNNFWITFGIWAQVRFHGCTFHWPVYTLQRKKLTLICPSPKSFVCNLPDSGRHVTRPNQRLLTGRRENLGTRLQRNNTNIDQDNIVTLSGNEYANQNLFNIRKQRVNQKLIFAYQHTTNILTFKHLNFKCAIWNYFWYQQFF